jgi:tetratricopeptide (TPR) repeat protein
MATNGMNSVLRVRLATGAILLAAALPAYCQRINNQGLGQGGNGQSRPLPSAGYFQHVSQLYNGDYKGALEGFKTDYSFALQAAGTHWVDSICHLTMAGECRLKMGRLADALDDYNSALKLYLAFPNWMTGIGLPNGIRPAAGARKSPWGQTRLNEKILRLPSTSSLLTDAVLLDPIPAPDGGSNFISACSAIQVNVQEVARCTALAMKRRHELMGPLCPQDGLSAALSALFARRPAAQNPCTKAWIDAELGFAYLGTGQTAQAGTFLKRAATIGDDCDHPLTPLVLLELGQLAADGSDWKSAASFFEEASYSAFDFGDAGVLEESIRHGRQAWLALHPGEQAVFPPLAVAIAWAKKSGRGTYADLTLLKAEDHLLLNQAKLAAGALADAGAAIARHDMATGESGARLHYLTAMLEYHHGHAAMGDRAMADALAFEQDGSRWLFQIHLINRYANGLLKSPISRKQALPILQSLLRDPTAADWSNNPLEAIAVLANLDETAFERWFDAARESDVDSSIEVADRLRRRRFYSALPLGGRLLAVRWILEEPADALTAEVQLQRQELLTRYPKYGPIAEQAKRLKAELISVPLDAASPDAARVQADKLAELGRVSAEQECLLREMAVRRENAEMLFPPLRTVKDIQTTIEPRQFIWTFFATGDGVYSWLISKNRCAAWKIESPSAVLEQKSAALLKSIGNVEGVHDFPRTQLADESWHAIARDAFDALTSGSKVNFRARIDELVIVPDGVLWYLPFEALDLGEDKLIAARPTLATELLSKCRIRYLPTLGLAVPSRAEHRTLGEVALVPATGRTREETDAAAANLDRFTKLGEHATTLKRPLPGSSPLYGSLFDTLVMLDEVSLGEPAGGDKPAATGERPPFDLAPIPLDHTRSAGSLAQWLALPRKSATQVILPDVHTPAEGGLKQPAAAPRGSEMFLSLCGLMSSGARTVLVSRWRTGGASSEELVYQFAQELPFTTASDAWQRGVQLLWETPLDLDREPRIKHAPGGEAPLARHPFFWSGYMLIDTGWSPGKPEQLAKKN